MKLVWLDSRPAGTQEGNTANTVIDRRTRDELRGSSIVPVNIALAI